MRQHAAGSFIASFGGIVSDIGVDAYQIVVGRQNVLLHNINSNATKSTSQRKCRSIITRIPRFNCTHNHDDGVGFPMNTK